MSDGTESGEVNEIDIAIVGLAGRYPGAPDVDAFWRNIRSGIESVSFSPMRNCAIAACRPRPWPTPTT
jgi:acyl transferase domain-containing protein